MATKMSNRQISKVLSKCSMSHLFKTTYRFIQHIGKTYNLKVKKDRDGSTAKCNLQ